MDGMAWADSLGMLRCGIVEAAGFADKSFIVGESFEASR
jgi:hypothetical protein